MNMIFLAVVVWLVYGAYQEGYLDKLLSTFEDGHSFTSIEEATCEDLKQSAIGRELTNDITEISSASNGC